MLAGSEADPYVTLQLPTSPGMKFKTKTVTNSSHPVWNETFSFLIQRQVKVTARVTHVWMGQSPHREGCWGGVHLPPELSQRNWGRSVLVPLGMLHERMCEPTNQLWAPPQQTASPLQAHLWNGDSKIPSSPPDGESVS